MVLACAGDVPKLETLAAVDLLRTHADGSETHLLTLFSRSGEQDHACTARIAAPSSTRPPQRSQRRTRRVTGATDSRGGLMRADRPHRPADARPVHQRHLAVV